MATYNLRGTEGEVSDNLIEILDAETKKADDMATEIEALKAERDALLARMANMEAEQAEEREEEAGDMEHGKKKDEDEDKPMGDSSELSAQVEALVQERLELIDQSRAILPQAYSFAGKLPAEIRADAVSAVIPDMDTTGMSEEEIKGAYLVALRTPSKPTKAVKSLAEATRGDSKEKSISARDKAMRWYNNPAQRGTNKEG